MERFNGALLDHLQQLRDIAIRYMDTTGFSMAWYHLFPDVAKELRRLWEIEKEYNSMKLARDIHRSNQDINFSEV